jgi:hypothetical protein
MNEPPGSEHERKSGLNINFNFHVHVTFDSPLEVHLRTVHRLASFGWSESKPREKKEEIPNA